MSTNLIANVSLNSMDVEEG